MKYLSSFCINLRIGLLPVLLLLPLMVLAEEVRVSCSNVADATERLACFDRTFPGETKPTTQQAESDSSQTRSVVPQVPADAPGRAAAAQTERPAPPSNNGMFSAKDNVNISSHLKSVRDSDKQKMVFLLENDQIWLQDSPRSLPFSKGQAVSIKSGTVGGYLLSNDKGVSTRVRRIK